MNSLNKLAAGLLACAVLITLLGVSAGPAYSLEETGYKVGIRAAKHEDRIRIVITADGSLIKNSSAVLDKNKLIVIEFRNSDAQAVNGKKTIAMQTEKGLIREDSSVEIFKSVTMTKRGSACAITVPKIKEIKVLKLQSPSRMVIDAFLEAPQSEEAVQAAAFKSLVDQVSLRTFVFDAGHGGYDYGIKGNRFSEKDFALAFARDLANILSKNGKDAQLTRKTDMVMTLAERTNAANRRMPDIFISFHISSTKVPTVYIVPDRNDEGQRFSGQKRREISRSISDAIARNIEKEFSINVQRETLPLPLLVKVKSPAIIVELPNPDEFNLEKKNRDRMLSAVIKGLAAATKEDRLGAPAQKSEVKPENRPEKRLELPPVAKPEKKPETNPESKAEGAKETR